MTNEEVNWEAQAKGIQGAYRLQAIELAQAKIDFWYERYNLAQVQINRWQKIREQRKAESREGTPNVD